MPNETDGVLQVFCIQQSQQGLYVSVYICILQGQSPLDVANQKRNKWLIDKLKRMRLEKGFDNIGVFQRKTTNNKV